MFAPGRYRHPAADVPESEDAKPPSLLASRHRPAPNPDNYARLAPLCTVGGLRANTELHHVTRRLGYHMGMVGFGPYPRPSRRACSWLPQPAAANRRP
jgi:hypothetical protein